MLPAYAFMGMTDDRLVDTEMGAAFAWAYPRADLSLTHESLVPTLNYYGCYGTLALMESAFRQAREQGLSWRPPSGHFAFPYAAVNTHKREGWAASVRGWSQYVWDWESGTKLENPYGRYMAFGGLLLFTQGQPLNLNASGIDLDGGFHWGYVPGATSKAMPMEKVSYRIAAAPRYVEGRHRNYTYDTFVGGLHHRGKNGLFAMRMRDTVTAQERGLFDDSFAADKSCFFFDNEIIALGSGIRNVDQRHHTITTLFQSKIGDDTPAASLDGKALKKNGQREQNGGWLVDPQGNYYLVTEGRVVLEQSKQQSLVPSSQFGAAVRKRGLKEVPISAPHVKAWIDHGAAPQRGAYEYQILVQGSESTVRQRLKRKSYRVHRKDSGAHIVEHLNSQQTAYALFAPQQDLPGQLKSVDTPLLLMSSREGEGLRLSVADPDLRLAKHGHNMSSMPTERRKQVSVAALSSIRLRGEWQLAAAHPDVLAVDVAEGETDIRIRLDHGLTRELQLMPAH